MRIVHSTTSLLSRWAVRMMIVNGQRIKQMGGEDEDSPQHNQPVEQVGCEDDDSQRHS
jgi:hypothetical protein